MYIASWSGGKDSCFACYKAMQAGHTIGTFVNFLSHDHGRVSFHGTDPALIKAQAELAGISLHQQETTMGTYEQEFIQAVRTLKDKGATGMVFGDIYLDEHRAWVEGVCGEIGITPLEPLWGGDTEHILRDFIAEGFQAVVVTGKAGVIDWEWIGRPVDKAFLDYIKTKAGVDPCGEKGEYHTLVTGGPLFHGRIDITASGVIERDGYRFLDIKEYNVSNGQ
jgi:diphthine-ammonia ligase